LVITRRTFLQIGVASAFSAGASGCAPCAANFMPNLAWPVFHGYKDYTDSAPLARVFYPTIDGTPAEASILTNCEHFPLVLLIHGSCPGTNPYTQWMYFAGQLARAGYVVAVTNSGGVLASGDPMDTAGLQHVHDFMRGTWEYRDTLMPSPNTAIIGHSFGGTLGAELAGRIQTKAFVGLSGTYGQVLPPVSAQSLLSQIRVPALFMWNTEDDPELNAEMYNPRSPMENQMWSFVGPPKHGVRFFGGNHGDYLLPGTSGGCMQGSCDLVRPLAVDLTIMFLARYLPPEGAGGIPNSVPDSLIVRPADLPPPPQNGFYSGGYLEGLSSSKQGPEPDESKQPCFQQVFWDLGLALASAYLVPS
jgi:dienelactone hydrolase